MDSASPSAFIHEPDRENPGWHTWALADSERFNAVVMGKLLVQREGDKAVRLRMFPETRHSNLHGNVHGGVTLSLIDIALFAAARIVAGADAEGSVTLELTNQFIGAGRVGSPLDAVAEVLRETRRLVFLRGLIMQGDDLVAAFNGTIRKPGQKPATASCPA